MTFLAAPPPPLTLYWAARWLCVKCGKFLTGDRNPPNATTSKCPHCGSAVLLETMCQGQTSRPLPFADKPARNYFGKIDRPYWQQQPARRIHRKGYKRAKGEKDKINGYHREERPDD
jgi:DNA-directed RNA polymerase subunit RPC12/RpoP